MSTFQNKITKKEFDKNYHDVDIDGCKLCGFQFDSFDTFYSLCDVWSGGHFFICPDCIEIIKEYLNGNITDSTNNIYKKDS